MKKILFVILSIFLAVNISAQNIPTEEEVSFAKLGADEWDFFIPQLGHIPTVKLKINDTIYICRIDSASGKSYINEDLVSPDSEIFCKCGKRVSKSEECDCGTIGLKYITLCEENDGEKSEIKFWFLGSGRFVTKVLDDSNSVKELFHDCTIGMDFLKLHKNVVFDYRNGKIVFDGEKISESSTKMSFVPGSTDKWVYVNMEYNGHTEMAILDTGAIVGILRKDFGKGEHKVDMVQFVNEYNSRTEIKLKNLNSKKIKNLKICDVVYPVMYCYPYNSTKLAVGGNRTTLKYYNFIGYEFFKDRVIQLDFEDGVFRIKVAET